MDKAPCPLVRFAIQSELIGSGRAWSVDTRRSFHYVLRGSLPGLGRRVAIMLTVTVLLVGVSPPRRIY